ncbi:FtsX-like permease family protein [Siccirubricoccus phaeus]|uniref:FtsX-like permease family protein n=1 Tax=Siccirubricoccus phaeus TaxID=2595053 RepID=UPI0011F2667B|nr:FtsX-like permease family protein [Siccirubricoccus phaeus]
MLPLRLALADLRGELRMTLCQVLAIAAILTPLLVLAGLRAGAVEGMRAAVLEDPLAREVMSLASREFTHDWLAALAARPEVLHLSPRTRQLAATLLLETPDGARQVWAPVVPSAPGDPLLPEGAPATATRVVLSTPLAARLGLKAGDALVGRLGRGERGAAPERLRVALTVQAVAPIAASDRDAIFAAPALADALEDWSEFRTAAPAEAGAAPSPAPREGYAGFRLYTRRLEDVPPLVTALRAAGIETRSRAQDIAPMLAIDAALGKLLLAIAAVAGSGLVLSLGAGLWANVERKRGLLAGLRLMGLGRGGVVLVPVAQAAALALGGAGLAAGLALAVQAGINAGLGGVLLDRPLSLLDARMLGTGIGITLLAAIGASALAAWQAARIEPYEAVRGG